MAVVIPVVAAFASGAAAVGAIAAATTTLGLVAGYASLAGAVLTGVGAITGKKDLMKVGGILSLAGGIGSIADGMMNSAASKAAEEGAKKMVEEATEAAAGEGALTLAANEGAALAAEQSGSLLSQGAADAAGAAGSAGGSLTPFADAAASSMGGAAASGGAAAGGAAAVEQAAQRAGTTLADVQALDAGGLGLSNMQPLSGVPEVAQAGSGLGGLGESLGSGFDAIKSGLSKTSSFLKQNKELAQLAGGALDGAFGPEAQMVKQREREQAMQQSLMDRAYANLNTATPIHSPRLTQLRLKGGI